MMKCRGKSIAQVVSSYVPIKHAGNHQRSSEIEPAEDCYKNCELNLRILRHLKPIWKTTSYILEYEFYYLFLLRLLAWTGK